jgi:hypothetical protein
MSWPFAASEPFTTAVHAVEPDRRRRGLTAEQHALAPTVVAAFQGAAHLAALLKAADVVMDVAAQVGRT